MTRTRPRTRPTCFGVILRDVALLKKGGNSVESFVSAERETGVEPATTTLAKWTPTIPWWMETFGLLGLFGCARPPEDRPGHIPGHAKEQDT